MHKNGKTMIGKLRNKIFALTMVCLSLTGCGLADRVIDSKTQDGHRSEEQVISSSELSGLPKDEAQGESGAGSGTEGTASAVLLAEPAESLPEGTWQAELTFPDWRGVVDTTLALNSMYSFRGYAGQGQLFVKPGKNVKSFRLFVNDREADLSGCEGGRLYRIDLSRAARNGVNTVQVSEILADVSGTKEADADSLLTEGSDQVAIWIPYPEVIDGKPAEEGICKETLDLISKLVESDVAYGFPGAQLAVIKNGRLVYENAWGKTNRYLPDGTPNEQSPDVTTETLYDLASVTKMFSVNYALQKLATDGAINLDAKISDFLGERFYKNVIKMTLSGGAKVDLETQRAWKSQITIRDLLRHQGGFPSDPRYFAPYTTMKEPTSGGKENLLFSGNDGSPETKKATVEAICKTPLLYQPGTKTVYSDVDYMVLGIVVEQVTGKDLDSYLKEIFFTPMGLTHITYNPLQHGFAKDDCAATELNGNTRDGAVSFPGIRRDTLQGEVHDEKAFYNMGGISGHAGLFSNATDLAKLASVMLTGGYGNHRFFSQNVMDQFTAPKKEDAADWGLGWWREGENQRVWYFGTQADSGAFGHQGWTGVFVQIDPSRDLVVVYLTNKINSPVTDAKKNANKFDGNWFTSATLGFVPQILSIGMDCGEGDVSGQLISLLYDMAKDSMKLIPEDAPQNHPAVRNAASKLALYEKTAGESYPEKLQTLKAEWSRIMEPAQPTDPAQQDSSAQSADADGRVILGDERTGNYLPFLENKRVALFSNQTGIVGDQLPAEHILDALIRNGVNVTAVFCPEHGFRGTADAGEAVENTVDEATGVPLLSLHGSGSNYPDKADIDRFDVLVVDIQDVGLRYYTYYISMYDLMDACAAEKKEVVVLDRPNPNGFYIDGPVLKDGFSSNVGRLPLPVVHGMTLGELARMINGEGWLKAGKDALKLTVIPCENYTHQKKTSLIVNPSPNLKDMRAVYLYASTCFFENTAVSVGRGTENPFEVYGSPYLKGLEGYEYSFTPVSMDGAKNPPFLGEVCYGVDLRGLSLETIWENGVNLEYLIHAYRDMKAAHPEISFFGKADAKGRYWLDLLCGTDEVRLMIQEGKTAEEIKNSWTQELMEFENRRAPYLLYPADTSAEKHTTGRETSENPDAVEKILAGMSTEQKIAQMLLPAVTTWAEEGKKAGNVTALNPEISGMIKQYGFGGIIFFAGNISDTAQTVRLTNELIEANRAGGHPADLFLAVDQEGGNVSRIDMGTRLCGNMALGAGQDETLAQRAAMVTGEELKALGFNLDFAPVADVNSNPDNPVIGIRSFSDDPALVAKLDIAFMDGLKEKGIISAIKHFPGHGDTKTDSHTGLPLIEKSKEELEKCELIPFRACVEKGVELIMTAHIQFPAIEKETRVSRKTGQPVYLPATLSKTIVTDLLRGEMHYQGVVITDAMNMDAVAKHFDPTDAAKLAINAGADLLLMPVKLSCKEDIKTLDAYIREIAKAVENGDIPKERIDESVRRILLLKEKYGLIPSTDSAESLDARIRKAQETVGSKAHHDEEWEITKKTVTLLKNENNLLPLKAYQDILIACPYDSELLSVEYALKKLTEDGLLKGDEKIRTICYDGKKSAEAKKLAEGAKVVIAVSALYGGEERSPFLDELLQSAHENGAGFVLISAQLPYDTARYPDADAILAVYLAKGATALNGGRIQYAPNLPVGICTVFGDNLPVGRIPVDICALNGDQTYSDRKLFPKGFGLEYLQN